MARVLLAVGLVAATVAFAAEPAGAASAWTVSPSPSPFRPEHIALASVSCATPTSCFAVGRRFDINEDEFGVVIERWNGTTWSIMVNSTTNATLNGVSCAGVKSCLAIGRNEQQLPFSKRWNGTKWTTVATGLPSSATLTGIDCATTTNCFAVGSYRSSSKTFTLIEHWNGTGWKKVPSPNLGASTRSVLNGVSCASTTSCFAVGNHEESGDQVGGVLIERWDGKAWTIQSAPNPTFTKSQGLPVTPLLTGVSCTGPKSCVAVGYASQRSLSERWNGAKWSIVATPTFPNGTLAELRSVSCTSATDCSAVGTKLATIDAREGVPLRNSINEHWNGTAWKVVPKPGPVPTNKALFQVGQLAELNGVSCPTKTSCAAVGNSSMAERWNGSVWSLAPLASTSSWSALTAVSCPAPTTCLAVGVAEPLLASAQNVLAERWDGATWSVVPSVTPSGTNVFATLASISCVGTTDCTAVGTAQKIVLPSSQYTGSVLIERWNGTKWVAVATPAPAAKLADAVLHAVSCSSATDCLAVGSYTVDTNQGPVTHMLSEHWNGTAWVVVAMPGSSDAQWNGISCASAASCTAVGFDGSAHALVAQWNGSSWALGTPASTPAGKTAYLTSVSCIGATDCTAAGELVGNKAQTLVERWNGATWSIEATPATTTNARLNAVSCTSATSCTAVGGTDPSGTYFPPTGTPIIERWNGVTWSVDPPATPPAGTGSVSLVGVACTSDTVCTAVGSHGSRRSSFTLVEHRT